MLRVLFLQFGYFAILQFYKCTAIYGFGTYYIGMLWHKKMFYSVPGVCKVPYSPSNDQLMTETQRLIKQFIHKIKNHV